MFAKKEDPASPASPPSSPVAKPNPKIIPDPDHNSRSIIHIGGIPVEFPYQPYGTQLAFMNRVISTLDRSQRDGHCHALLESPTGTGKSLSLLCSVLAWQKNQKMKNIYSKLAHPSSRPNPEAVTDPIKHGGGFIPETQPSGNPVTPSPATTNAKTEKLRLSPTIFYSSRTHAQIKQVIREYKKTSYRAPMAVLGSRKHYCTHPDLHREDNVDEQCKLLLKNVINSCPHLKNVHKVQEHSSLQKGGCHEVHDIEDLVKVGKSVKGCSYFAARSMAKEADLIFCPYNYIINPVIRAAMDVDIIGSIIIFDEAHNIEDITRDAGSIDLDEEDLIHLQTELGQLSLKDDLTYRPLFEMTEDMLSWIDRRKITLVKRESQLYFRCWTGDKALKELEEANISQWTFAILCKCAQKAIQDASEVGAGIPCLSGGPATTLEGLFSSLSYFFSGNGAHARDYDLVVQRFVKKGDCKYHKNMNTQLKKDERSGHAEFVIWELFKLEGDWTTTFSLWCLNPAVVFKSIAAISQSVILTSGTLSPLSTFSSELGVQFGTCLEAPHVIDVDSQVWVAAIANGPGRYPLNASYKTADEYAFQDAVGSSLEEICKVVPGGCLAFFPSYKLLDKLSNRWEETGQWSRLNAQKSLFVEPRGSTQESFEAVLKDYYNAIRHGTRQLSGRKIRGKRLGLRNGNSVESTKDTKKEGAAFLAVCRGRISEGMDFSDDKARVVVVVGIPFPNIYDVKVSEKKKFNDTYETSKNLLSGNEWYCQQAFRALNQATGRCIRHRFDYGAIIYLDERFHRDRNRAYISKWLRNSIKLYSSFEESLDGLKSFFSDVKVRIGVPANSSKDLEEECDNIESVDKKKWTRKEEPIDISPIKKEEPIGSLGIKKEEPIDISPIKKEEPIGSLGIKKEEPIDLSEVKKTSGWARPSVPVVKYDSPSAQTRSGVSTVKDGKSASGCKEYIDLECDSDKDSRPETPLVGMSSDDPELTIVKETPAINYRRPESTPESFSKEKDIFFSSPKTNPQQFSSGPKPSQKNPHDSPISCMCSSVTTSKQEISPLSNSTTPEADSSWSVNNIVSKRRKITGFSSVPLQVPDRFSSLASSITTSEDKCDTPNDSEGNMDDRLKISCSLCKNTLGLPENNFFVTCSLITTSKVHLMSMQQKKGSESVGLNASSVDIFVSDLSSVDQHLCGAAQEQEVGSGQGVWCKEDGCVFKTVFCPFCVDNDNCIGVQVLATDASNVKFQNKILLYRDRVEIKNVEAAKEEAISPQGDSTTVKKVDPHAFDKFAYISIVEDSTGGWRSTKSRTSKKEMNCNTKTRCEYHKVYLTGSTT
ncbi:hypothetical protein OROGR_022347 [Orobanche gracilis]